MKKILVHLLFVVIVAGDLLAVFFDKQMAEFIFKPLIVVWIAAYFFIHIPKIDKNLLRIAGFAFLASLAGDCFLMFSTESRWFFIAGLGSFLAAQVLYAFLFLRTIELSGKKSFLKKRPVYLFPYFAYGFIVFILLMPKLDAVLRIAVFVYILGIMGMAAMALNRFGNGHPISFSLVFTGSLFFIVSDTLIAVDRFLAPVPFGGLLVMATYIVAQFLIMTGLLKQYE